MTAPYVELTEGHRLFVRDWGAGPPVLLLAGWAMDSRLWGETMVHLNACGLRTIAYDRRGHGRSTDPGFTDYDVLADDLARVLEALDLSDVTVVSHSGAAGEVIRYASRHETWRLRRAILIGATGPAMIAGPDNPIGIPRDAFDHVVTQLETDLDAWLAENTRPFAPGAPDRTMTWLQSMVLDTSRRALVDFQRTIGEADLRDEAAGLRLPVTIITGDRDISAPPDLTARRYAELIPDCELVIYEGVAHGVMVTDMARLATDIATRALLA